MPRINARTAVAAAAIAATTAAGGTAFAQSQPAPIQPAAGDSTVIVSPRTQIAAPANSPIDFAGVRSARRGKPLAAGYVVVSRHVKVTRGAEVAYGAMRMTCPKGKTLRSFGSTGSIGGNLATPSTKYVGKSSWLMMATYGGSQVKPGQAAEGNLLAICR